MCLLSNSGSHTSPVLTQVCSRSFMSALIRVLSLTCVCVCSYVLGPMCLLIWELIQIPLSGIRHFRQKKYVSQTFACLRFIFRRSMLYLCEPCLLCFVHVNGFFFTGKYQIETALFVSMCLLLDC